MPWRPRMKPPVGKSGPGTISRIFAIGEDIGVIGDVNFTTRPLLANYDADVINTATYAVTVEQSGGSPDGVPHSQPVFIGKLIETVPASR